MENHEMSDYREIFLMKSVLGKDVNSQSPKSVRWYCVDKAYDDMMSGGRYLSITGKKARQAKIYEILDAEGWKFDRTLIRDVTSCFDDCVDGTESNLITANERTGTTFGLSQKVVNMTFKYLYVFNEYIKDMELDFTNCDCPIDSFVIASLKSDKPLLSQLNKDEVHILRNAVWSNLTEEEYNILQRACGMAGSNNEDLQEAIKMSEGCSRRLLYDFFAW